MVRPKQTVKQASDGTQLLTDRTYPMDLSDQKRNFREPLTSLLVLISAVPLALYVHFVNLVSTGKPEWTLLLIGATFVILLITPPALYITFGRDTIAPAQLGLIIIATVCVLLVSVYLYWVSFYVLFPADIFIWSESDFVNDILKFRLGYPIYTAFGNNESQVYTPGAQIVTYLIAYISGHETSIPLYRIIQLGFNLVTAVVASLCCWVLIKMTFLVKRIRERCLWMALWLPLFFLIATNYLTNPFSHNLHNEALLQLITVGAYWLLLRYAHTQDKRLLAVMAILPAVGFLVKQSFVVWAPLYCLYLIFFDRPRSVGRVATFTVVVFGSIGAVIGGCYLLWGDPFLYWIFAVLGERQISLLRSFQHILDCWAYLMIGLFGGLILIRGDNYKKTLGLWLVWLVLFLAEGYTSGAAWTRSHMGPGSLIAGIWFVAAVVRTWPTVYSTKSGSFHLQKWLRTGIAVALLCLIFSGLGFIRIPLQPLGNDAYRYIKEIEYEFKDESADNILLDVGTWIYLQEGVVMKDRATSIGDRGYQGMGGFADMIKRLKEKHYSKILVRNLKSPDFWYDHFLWPKSSGIRETLLDNYQETDRIMAVSPGRHTSKSSYLFGEISILSPRLD